MYREQLKIISQLVNMPIRQCANLTRGTAEHNKPET